MLSPPGRERRGLASWGSEGFEEGGGWKATEAEGEVVQGSQKAQTPEGLAARPPTATRGRVTSAGDWSGQGSPEGLEPGAPFLCQGHVDA